MVSTAVKVSISQPRYIPSLDYIRRILLSDVFVIYDDIKRTYDGWENRNKIMVNGSPKWLTIPVSSSRTAKINEAVVSPFVEDHLNKIEEAYRGSKAFSYGYELMRNYYLEINDDSYLNTLVHPLMWLMEQLDYNGEFVFASDISNPKLHGTERLADICKQVGGTHYISGRFGRTYGVNEQWENQYRLKVEDDIWSPGIYKEKDFNYLAFIHYAMNLGHKWVEAIK